MPRGLDPRLFSLMVVGTGVRKGYNWLELPPGVRAPTPPGKYMSVDAEGMEFGFEAPTEEIGEDPDWDYGDVRCRVAGGPSVYRLECRIDSPDPSLHDEYRLYYAGNLVFRAPAVSQAAVATLRIASRGAYGGLALIAAAAPLVYLGARRVSRPV